MSLFRSDWGIALDELIGRLCHDSREMLGLTVKCRLSSRWKTVTFPGIYGGRIARGAMGAIYRASTMSAGTLSLRTSAYEAFRCYLERWHPFLLTPSLANDEGLTIR